MMNVSLDDAYREACTALGEAIVRERLLLAALEQVEPTPHDLGVPNGPE